MIHLCFWTKFKFMKHILILQKSTINFLDIDLSLYYFSNYSLPLATIRSFRWIDPERNEYYSEQSSPVQRPNLSDEFQCWEFTSCEKVAWQSIEQSVDHFVPSVSLDLSMAEFNKIEMNSHCKCLTNVNNLENNRGFSKNNCNCYKQ